MGNKKRTVGSPIKEKAQVTFGLHEVDGIPQFSHLDETISRPPVKTYKY